MVLREKKSQTGEIQDLDIFSQKDMMNVTFYGIK